MTIEPLELALGPGLDGAMARLAAALTGRSPIAPRAPGPPPTPGAERALAQGAGRSLDGPEVLTTPDLDDLAVVIGTSGSTGRPKLAMLTARALAASIGGTHRALGGPGQWLLALPPHHIAGLQVLFRGLVAGTPTVALTGPFSISGFTAAAARLDSAHRHYTALVPTQLTRLLEDPHGAEALRGFDAVLVGGTAIPARLRERADTAGVVTVATYGMSETAGGCIYDGRPLPGARVAIDDNGRILLGGPTLASGYLGRADLTRIAFSTDACGTPWFATDDLGCLHPDGRLHVEGRLDALITTGAVKVDPRAVEEAILSHCPQITEVLVVGVPDDLWGERVCALVVLDQSSTRSAATANLREVLRAQLRGALPDYALPMQVLESDSLPTLGPGKPDFEQARSRFVDG